MPQRTNEFQELVTLIQHALAPVGAKMTPSAMVEVDGQQFDLRSVSRRSFNNRFGESTMSDNDKLVYLNASVAKVFAQEFFEAGLIHLPAFVSRFDGDLNVVWADSAFNQNIDLTIAWLKR
jgi:hypothetical protein